VALCGLGGAGKSRLAAEPARGFAAKHPDPHIDGVVGSTGGGQGSRFAAECGGRLTSSDAAVVMHRSAARAAAAPGGASTPSR
jgi:hypothetical protein